MPLSRPERKQINRQKTDPFLGLPVSLSVSLRLSVSARVSKQNKVNVGALGDLDHRPKIPFVRFPKYGAIPPLRPFRLFDSSFESPWRLKWGGTSLNLQIGVVVEI